MREHEQDGLRVVCIVDHLSPTGKGISCEGWQALPRLKEFGQATGDDRSEIAVLFDEQYVGDAEADDQQ